MDFSNILKGINVVETNVDLSTEITGINYNSREIEKGNIFVAIKGFSTDGHKYIKNAIENGASVIVCEDVPNFECPYVKVNDSRYALAIMGANFYDNPSKKMKVIGITGTNGKTTTTYLLKQLLENLLNAKVGLIGTIGNMIGDEFIHSDRTTPESLELQKLFSEMYEKGCTYVVMEVSSHSIALNRVAGIEFEVSSFTNLTQDHLDFHGTMENYAATKAEIFKSSKRTCVNMDDEWSQFMLENAKKYVDNIITYSVDNSDADITANYVQLSTEGVRFCTLYNDELVRTSLGIPGMFSVHNALGVISIAVSLGIPFEDVCNEIQRLKGVKGRVEVVPTDGDYTIIIDYAHTPDALENVLKTVKEVTDKRLVSLFGCGGDRDRTKRPIMGRISSEIADFSIITSDNPRTEEPMAIINEILVGVKCKKDSYKVIADRKEAICWAIDNHQPGDVIVLAGKGHEDYQEVGHDKIHMDEREIVSEHIEEGKRK